MLHPNVTGDMDMDFDAQTGVEVDAIRISSGGVLKCSLQ